MVHWKCFDDADDFHPLGSSFLKKIQTSSEQIESLMLQKYDLRRIEKRTNWITDRRNFNAINWSMLSGKKGIWLQKKYTPPWD